MRHNTTIPIHRITHGTGSQLRSKIHLYLNLTIAEADQIHMQIPQLSQSIFTIFFDDTIHQIRDHLLKHIPTGASSGLISKPIDRLTLFIHDCLINHRGLIHVCSILLLVQKLAVVDDHVDFLLKLITLSSYFFLIF